MQKKSDVKPAGTRIGLIAGNGPFPAVFAKKARDKGFDVFAVGYLGETDPGLKDLVCELEMIHIGQLGRLIKFFRRRDITDAVMIGGIRKAGIFSRLRPDLKGMALLARMRKADTHDDRVLRTFADFLEESGIRIRPSTFLMPDLLAPWGIWTKRWPAKKERADMALGWRMAKAVGSLDIGQCVVVENGSVLAVEAIDGTDSTIKRGGSLGEGGAVVVKVCKPAQDFRFDVPAVGSNTIATMADSGARVLVVEAQKTVIYDRDEMVRLADEKKISIVGMKEEEDAWR